MIYRFLPRFLPTRNLGLFFLLSSTPSASCFASSSPSFLAVQQQQQSSSRSRSSHSLNRQGLFSSPLGSIRGGGGSFSTSAATPKTALNMMSTKISFTDSSSNGDDTANVACTMVIGKKKDLQALPLSTKIPGLSEETAQALLDSIDGPSGSASTFVGRHKVVLACIPPKVTRNNHPWSVHTITELVAGGLLPAKGQTSRLVFVGDDGATEYPGALASAVAKAFPVFSRKTSSPKKDDDDDDSGDAATKNDRVIQIAFWKSNGDAVSVDERAARAALAAVDGVQLAARLVDMPPEELTTDAYAAECQALADSLEGVTMTEIIGEELDKKGYGGIYGVGKAATCPPRLLILEYKPPSAGDDAKVPVALVGKAIIYDTGGLSLKPKVGMCGMKVGSILFCLCVCFVFYCL